MIRTPGGLSPFEPFAGFLRWLDSDEGLEHRRQQGGLGDETDQVCLVPDPPGRTIYTVADLRALVAHGRGLKNVLHRVAGKEADLAHGEINLMDLGAPANGVDDDTPFLQAALNSRKSVYLPPGVYSVSRVFLESPQSQRVRGAGCGDNDTRVFARDPVSNVFHVRAGQVEIDHLNFFPGVRRQSGSYIYLDQNDCHIERCRFNGGHVGVAVNGSSNSISWCEFRPAPGDGEGVVVIGGANLTLFKCYMNWDGLARYNSGVTVQSCQDIQVLACQIIQAGACIRVAPGPGQTAASVILGNTFLDNGWAGLYVSPGEGGQVLRLEVANCWFGSSSTYGAYINPQGGGTRSGFAFRGCRFVDCGIDGLFFDRATHLDVSACRFAANHHVGLNVGPAARRVAVRDSSIGPLDGMSGNRIGLQVQAGADEYMISGNWIYGNSANLVEPSPGPARLVQGNMEV